MSKSNNDQKSIPEYLLEIDPKWVQLYGEEASVLREEVRFQYNCMLAENSKDKQLLEHRCEKKMFDFVKVDQGGIVLGLTITSLVVFVPVMSKAKDRVSNALSSWRCACKFTDLDVEACQECMEGRVESTAVLYEHEVVDYVAEMGRKSPIVADITNYDLRRIASGELEVYGQREKKDGVFFRRFGGNGHGSFVTPFPPGVETAEFDGRKFVVLLPFGWKETVCYQGYLFVPHPFQMVTDSNVAYQEGVILLTSEGEKRFKREYSFEVKDPIPGVSGIWECVKRKDVLVPLRYRPYKIPDLSRGARSYLYPSYEFWTMPRQFPFVPFTFVKGVKEGYASVETPWFFPQYGIMKNFSGKLVFSRSHYGTLYLPYFNDNRKEHLRQKAVLKLDPGETVEYDNEHSTPGLKRLLDRLLFLSPPPVSKRVNERKKTIVEHGLVSGLQDDQKWVQLAMKFEQSNGTKSSVSVVFESVKSMRKYLFRRWKGEDLLVKVLDKERIIMVSGLPLKQVVEHVCVFIASMFTFRQNILVPWFKGEWEDGW